MGASAWHLTLRQFTALFLGFLLLVPGQTVQIHEPADDLQSPVHQDQNYWKEPETIGDSDMAHNGGYKTVAYYVNWVCLLITI